ncbi:polysaccharide deacetylase family protein [Hymenobacter setariae]|nr:polysaccharide deacetylase family protein [Hymenobacter setariae]
MYHQVAEPATDIWDLAVSPAHFEQQLRVLKQTGQVVSTTELSERLHLGTLKRRSIAITFDDGYLDNYLQASPLLTRYQLPATFFVVSENVGLNQEFWWDELAGIFLESEYLPPSLALILPGGDHLGADLRPEQHLTPALRQQHQQWRAIEQAPPTLRAALFYRLWQQLRPLPAPAQQACLQQLRTWASWPPGARPIYRTISPDQLHELHSSPLVTIGAHTATHPALASHPAALQQHEVATGRQALHQALGEQPMLLAYPYGSYNRDTTAIAAQLGFKAAFTTDAQLITAASPPHKLGRFQVNNWNGDEFKRRLTHWFNH